MSAADPAVLQQVLAAEGIHPDPATPSRFSWLVDYLSAFVNGLGDRVASVPGMGGLVWAIAGILAVVLAVLALLAAWRLARAVGARRRDAAGAPPPVVATLDPPDARRFRGESEAALAAGRPRDAVRAAWSWVAWTLHERAIARYEPDLTNREFVDVVHRSAPGWRPLPGLRSFARRADTLCYDAAEPHEADARALLGLADRMLGESG